MSECAIQVLDVSKKYKLYDNNKARLFDALGLAKKAKYKEHYALHHLDFHVAKGECVGIIGTNGAGKSTILKIITGVLSATEGEVLIDGRISALLELGAGFNPEYTGMENIYLNGTMMGFSKEEIDGKLESILEFADIGDFVYQPVKSYSSGMFVRLAFAVAINIEPEILIVDEALSVGDVFFQSKCYHKFDEFKRMGKTILFVSHDMGSMAKYCDRVILLHKGNKMAEGSPKEMIDLYKKLMVSQRSDVSVNNPNQSSTIGLDAATLEEIAKDAAKFEASSWKQYFKINPSVDTYGTGKAEIIDYAVMDEKKTPTATVVKGQPFYIKSKIKFFEDIQAPIFTYTIKNIKGVAITGTNTMFEDASLEVAKAGETYVCTFAQEMSLQGGDYLLSISCTGYVDGEFQVYHRMYDLLNITVVSDKDTVGFFDMNSKVSIEKEE